MVFITGSVITTNAQVQKKKTIKPSINSRSREKGEKETRIRIDRSRRSSGNATITLGEGSKPGEFNGKLTDLPQTITENERSLFERSFELDLPLPKNKKPLPGSQPFQPPIQFTSMLAPMPSPIVTFNAMTFVSNGAGFPPDTVGDVGPNHYVQGVNTSMGVYNKTTGAAMATVTLNNFWSGAGTGTPCDTSHQGDPTVIYDPAHNRFIVADFTWSNIQTGPYYECIAVSKTADPTGAWWLYAIRSDDATHPWLPDYPKMGIWPDGLYMGANMFQCTNASCSSATYKEARGFVFNINKMVNGTALTANDIQFADTNNVNRFTMLPANYRGTAPPAGSPNYFVEESGTAFSWDVSKFHVDYTTPANSTFTGPVNVSQTTYTLAASTVPEPAGGNALATLADRAMMQNQYRNIGGVESVWVNHTTGTVAAATPTGLQWAQINVTGGTIVTTPVQEQIFNNAADGVNRFIGALAVDKQGNMAIGYSASNASTAPDIRYAGRLVGDTLGQLPQTEVTMLPAVTRNLQTGAARYGDYSSMSVDPSDDCTFWYTSMFYPVTGSNWTTRIGSFKFPGCTATVAQRAPFDFDGDNKTDISIFRPAAGQWWYLKSSNGGNAAASFGTSSDVLTPGDFTGDGKADLAFFRPGTGFWFILRSEDFSFYSFPFGTSGDIPVTGDYDGDGKADAAVFRPSNNTWYINKSGGGTTITTFGAAGDLPVAADYDGDGKADIAIFRPSNGQWWLSRSTAGLIVYTFGSSTDKCVPGDYTGDGKADVAFYRPTTGTWFIQRSEDNSFYSFPFGTTGDVPSPGDYDGDGKFDAAQFRPSTNTWYVNRSTAGVLIQPFGTTGDISVPNAYVR